MIAFMSEINGGITVKRYISETDKLFYKRWNAYRYILNNSCPQSAEEALSCVRSLEILGNWFNRNADNLMIARKPSKRNRRLVRTFWAFKHQNSAAENH